MIRVASRFCILAGTILLPSVSTAQSLWVGRWFYVPEASRRSPSSLTLTALPNGRLRFEASWGAFILDPSGKLTPELTHPTTLVRTEMLTPSTFRYVEFNGGRPVERVEARLSADGTQLRTHVTSFGDDGRKTEHDTVSLRVGSGRGLAGRWRELPPKHDAVREGLAQPYWVISEDASRVMTWRVVPTGELLVGQADDRQHPSAGPGREGQSFRIKVLGPRHLQFYIYDTGHLIAQTDEQLSADGKRWTDLIWSPTHREEKDRLIYRRQ